MRVLFIVLFFLPIILYSQQFKLKERDYFEQLNDHERRVMVEKGTERPFSGFYIDHFKDGIYLCKACNNPLFNSNAKFKSNCGWPSFDDEIKNAIVRESDYSLGMSRIEISCSNCKGHLGHVFNGEKLTKKNTRHCVNSLSIKFVEN